jgi:hypothetical protein
MRKSLVPATVVPATILFAGVLAVMPLAMSASPALAQAPPDLINSQIQIQYVPPPPDNADFTAIYNRLIKRKPLETLQQFLAPLKLDQPLLVEVDQCGAAYAPYTHGGPVKVCYEFVQQVESLAPTAPIALIQTEGHTPLKPDAAVVGPFVQELLHEVAVALFDLYGVPVWGRSDDAADRLTALILLNFPQNDMAWNTIVGTELFLSASALSPPDMSDARGVTAQRYYTALCLAYGGDKKTFGSFVLTDRRASGSPTGDPDYGNAAAGDLPAERATVCPQEYADIKAAFDALIMPHVDPALMQKVQAVQWIDFND